MFHKTSSRLWWYYGQAYSISFHNKLKSIQYDNALALKHNFPSAMGVLVMGVDDFEMGGGTGSSLQTMPKSAFIVSFHHIWLINLVVFFYFKHEICLLESNQMTNFPGTIDSLR